jgi:hypothetical protein
MRYLPLVFLLFCGCLTPKKAERRLQKIEQKQSDALASKCSVLYPCLPKKADTLYTVEYDLIEVECPDGQIPYTNKDSNDTVYIIKYNEKRVTKEIRIPCESKTIIQYVEDSAKVRTYRSKLLVCDQELKIYKAKASKNGKLVKILSLLLLSLIILVYLRRKK